MTHTILTLLYVAPFQGVSLFAIVVILVVWHALLWFVFVKPNRRVYRGEMYLLTKSEAEAKAQRKTNTFLVHERIDQLSVNFSDKDRRKLKEAYNIWQKKEKSLFVEHAKGRKLALLKQVDLHGHPYPDTAFKEIEPISIDETYEILLEGVFSDIPKDYILEGDRYVRSKISMLAILLDITADSSKGVVFVERHTFWGRPPMIMFDIYRKKVVS